MSGGYKNNFMDDNDLKIIQGVKNYMGESPVIIDVGANRGNYTDFALTLFPNAKVVLIEPNDMWIDELKRKYSDNKNIDIFNTLISDHNGGETFYYFTNHNDQISSIYKRPVFHDLPMKEMTKCCATIDNVISAMGYYHVDFVKVDTEGAEFKVLKGAVKSLAYKKIKFIQIEYGGTYPDAGITMKQIIDFANNFGYYAYSYDKVFTELNSQSFVEDFHYDNYLISNVAL